jgi:glycerol-3-phosphate acyltransferase PlsX
MQRPVSISIDAMGGDHGPPVTVAGVDLAAERHPAARFVLFGDEKLIRPALAAHPRLEGRVEVVHTDIAVRMDDKPSQALRMGRWKSSMWLALDAVKTGRAQVCVSAGNTGALMVMAKFCLRMTPGIDRPSIAAIWPTVRGESIVLDVGASIGAEPKALVDMAILGAAMARALFGVERPTVGLLNIGVEEQKGLEPIREAGRILREADPPGLEYAGFVEGNDLGKGAVDVVVTEGFAGNIALKTAEGTAKQIAEYLRSAMGRTLMSRIGYVFARGAFGVLRDKMDPRKANGGVFLGLNGIVIKSHGGTDALGFAAAVELGHDMVRSGLREKIETDLARFQPPPEREAVAS